MIPTPPPNPLLTLKDMKAFVREKLAERPDLVTESERRSLLKSHCPFRPSEARYQDFQNAIRGVLTEKPSKKLLRDLKDIPDHLTEWASRNNIVKESNTP